ncbi:MAG: response regulator, partial [Verrucomicrobiota bacterium]
PLDVAPDGKEALQYLFSSSEPAAAVPCLIILDLNLPRVSGLEVLQRVRQAPQFKDLPIVIFSSSAQTSDQERATEFGATAYIVKPTTIDQIVAVAKELDRRWLATCIAKR